MQGTHAGGRDDRRRTFRVCLFAISALAVALALFVGSATAQNDAPALPSLPLPTLPQPTPPSAPQPPESPAVPSPEQLLNAVKSLPDRLGSAAGLVKYTIHAVYQPPEGAPVTTTMTTDEPALIAVPTPVNVDRSGGPDITGQLVLDPTGRLTFNVRKLPGAPARLPLSVEAVISDPSGIVDPAASSRRIAFGYDTRSDTAPGDFSGTISYTSAAGTTNAALDFTVADPGRRLAITAERFRSGEGDRRLDVQGARLSYAAVPASAHVGLKNGPGSTVEVTSTTASAVADFGASFVDGERKVSARIQELPSQLQIVYSPDEGKLSYDASAEVDRIAAEATDPAGIAGRATKASVLLRSVPKKLEFAFGSSDGTVTVDAGGETLGLAEAQLTSGPDDRLDPDVDGVLLRDLADRYVAFARITGLRKLTFVQGDETKVELDTTGGRVLQADLSKQAAAGAPIAYTRARLDRLPSHLAVGYTPASGRIAYAASAPVDELTIDAFDPAGIAGRAKRAHVLLRSIPTQLDVTAAPSGGAVTLDAQGQTLGLLEAQLTSGPQQRLPDEVDGVLISDMASSYVAFVRITGLRRVAVNTKGSGYEAQLVTTGGRPFKVDLNQQPASGGQASYIRASFDRLPSQVRAAYLPRAGKVIYDADGPVRQITVDAFDPKGLTGRAKEGHVLLRSVPTALTLTLGSSGGSATLDAGGQTLGLVEAQLTSRPNERLDPSVDGVLLRDLPDRYVVFARVSGLRRVSIAQSGSGAEAHLSTTGGRLLRVDVNQSGTSTVAVLDRLQPQVDIIYAKTDATRIRYSASGPTNSLTFDTNAGGEPLHGSLAGPLPADVQICQSGGNACKPGQKGGNGTVTFATSEPTTANITKGKLVVRDMRGRLVEVAIETHGSDEGWVYLNTGSQSLSGFATDDSSFRVAMPPGFSAQDRVIHYKLYKLWGVPYRISVDRSGGINCPPGTKFEARVAGNWMDVTHGVSLLGVKVADGVC